MADDNILRSYRSNDAARRAAAAANRDVGASDPLAELARLIGQTDPFADMDRGADRGRGQASAADSYSGYGSEAETELDSRFADEAPHTDAALTDWRKTAAAMAREALRDSSATEQRYAEVDSAIAAARSLRATPADQFAQPGAYAPSFDDTSVGYDQATDSQDAYVDAAYGDGPQGHFDTRPHDLMADRMAPAMAPALSPTNTPAMSEPEEQDSENYFFDGATVPPEPGFYDDPPRPRAANGLVTALVLVGCGILGTAGAYGYRTYYSGVRPTDAPIISADKAPIKVMPTSIGGDPQSGKSVERVGGGKEQLVGRQEEPVTLPDPASPRVVVAAPFGVPGAGSPPQSSASIPNAPSVTAALPPTPSVPGEPKKVRTVPIRPNGGMDSMAQPTGNLSSPPASQPSATPAHQAQSQSAKQATAHNGGGPLSLDPQGQPAPGASSYQPVAQPAPSPPPAAPRLASAASTPVSAPSGSGGFMVQISSQRNEADAQTSFRSLQKQFPKQLGDREAVVRRADLGDKGVFYRALVGPFEGSDAEQLCSELKRDGGKCLVLKN